MLLLSHFSHVDSVRPNGRQPTRLPRPSDSPGENTGVGCHFLLQCMKVKSESEVDKSYLTLHDPVDCSLPGSSVHGILQARVLEWGAIAFSNAEKRELLEATGWLLGRPDLEPLLCSFLESTWILSFLYDSTWALVEFTRTLLILQ